jgi:hypothetical protein
MAADVASEYPQIAEIREELRSVNEALWDAETALRARGSSSSSDQGLVDLAMAMCARREERSRLTSAIDRLLGTPS